MSAAATLPAIATPRATDALRPVVFHNGHPEPGLVLEQTEAFGPLDLRKARLRVLPSVTGDRFESASVVAALPRILVDDQVVWDVLGHGRLTRIEEHEAEGTAQQVLELDDAWAADLRARPQTLWEADNASTLRTTGLGRLIPGNEGNRSAQRFVVHGRTVHVPQSRGEPWTLGTALETVSAFYQLGMDVGALPPSVLDEPLRESIDLTEELLPQLEQLFDTFGLFLRRRLRLVNSAVRESRSVHAAQHGRLISWPVYSSRPGHPLIRSRLYQSAPRAARQWIAMGEAPLVESTFTLRPGWDAALEGGPDAQYELASDHFSRFANVYRRWVLNEDGQLDGEAFDLATLFGQPGLRPAPLALRDCLTLDDAGTRLPPVLEISIDGGTTWSRYGGAWRRLQQQAGVYLDDASLESATLQAAKVAELRVRVTAALQSPRATEAARWSGNPFGPTQQPRRLDGRRRFRFRAVRASSIHHADLLAGTLQADHYDDTHALQTWLLQSLDTEERSVSAGRGSSALLKTPQAHPEFRVGDRLRGFDIQGRHPTNQTSSVIGVLTRFGPKPTTQLTLEGQPSTPGISS